VHAQISDLQYGLGSNRWSHSASLLIEKTKSLDTTGSHLMRDSSRSLGKDLLLTLRSETKGRELTQSIERDLIRTQIEFPFHGEMVLFGGDL
jgi:hypothetical protein